MNEEVAQHEGPPPGGLGRPNRILPHPLIQGNPFHAPLQGFPGRGLHPCMQDPTVGFATLRAAYRPPFHQARGVTKTPTPRAEAPGRGQPRGGMPASGDFESSFDRYSSEICPLLFSFFDCLNFESSVCKSIHSLTFSS